MLCIFAGMSANHADLTGLKQQLDRLDWPAVYPFKFIVPIEQVQAVMALFSKSEVQTRVSRNGNYISLTARPLMYNSEKVIEKYREALQIEGLIAL